MSENQDSPARILYPPINPKGWSAIEGRLGIFANHPILTLVSLILAVIGVASGFYFFFAAQRHRALTYLVHPAKAVIVKSGEVSTLSVSVAGRPISTDLIAAQVALWNDGNESIRPEHVLLPVILRTEPRVPIIEATVRKVSREVVRLALDKTKATTGEIGVSWAILEQDDGAVVQIVYAGGVDATITMSATIEGQNAVDQLHTKRPQPGYQGRRSFSKEEIIRLLATGLSLPVALLVVFFVGRKRGRFPTGILIVGVLFGAFLTVISVFFERNPAPPFGF